MAPRTKTRPGAPPRRPANEGKPNVVNDLDLDALNETVEAIKADPSRGLCSFQATTAWTGGFKTESRIDEWSLGGQRIPQDYVLKIDEPGELLGEDTAANPQMILQAAMNACMLNTFVAAAAIMGVELESVELESSGDLDLRGFLGIDESVPAGYQEIDITVRVRGDGTSEQYQKMLELVQRQSPNYYTLTRPVRLNMRVEEG